MPDTASRRFTDSHEWFAADGDLVTVGITPYAANELTDITYVEMKPPGTQVTRGDTLGEVESVKTTSDVFAALDGEVVEINQSVADDPSLLNSDPYGAGWLLRLRVADASPLSDLLDQSAYDQKHPVA